MSVQSIQTPYGVFSGILSSENYPDGGLLSIRLEERNMILTHAGELVPFYGEETLRRKNKASVSFHLNGMIKSVALEEQQEVITPIGELPAELVTFYDTGELCRVFPLDGKISGFWSEEDERALNFPLSFDLDFATFTAMLSGICFYKDGQIRSVTLYPGEEISVALDGYGAVEVRHGFSLYDTGALASLEPASPVKLQTPIGLLTAYDPNAVGICADSNSLTFDKQGRLTGLKTAADKLRVVTKNGGVHSFSPLEVGDDDDDGCGAAVLPVSVSFRYNDETVMISDAETAAQFSFRDDFFIHPTVRPLCNPSDCANCSLCNK